MEIGNSNEKQLLKMIDAIDVPAFVGMDLNEKMAVMVGLGREIVRGDIGPLIAAAIVAGNEASFPVIMIEDDAHKEKAKSAIIEVASEVNATCLVVMSEAWYVKHAPDAPYSHVSPSLHPARGECLMVAGKDHFEHLLGTQHFRRTGDEIIFGELKIGPTSYSWLNDWEPHLRAATAC